MSMNPEQEDFQQLRRLLTLKRHEQPPPGYFEGFSRQVIVRIRAGEGLERESLTARFLWELPWLQRLWSGLQARPALAGAFGVLVCGLAISGAVFSEHNEVPPDMGLAQPGQPNNGLAIGSLVPVNGSPQFTKLESDPEAPRPSLFEEVHRANTMLLQAPLQAEPVSARIYVGQ